jgi:intracellular multiplication protein IcmE
MTNNFENNEHEHNEDFNEPEIGTSDARRGMGGNIAEAWRSRPLFKFMVLIIAVFAVLVAGFSFMGGNNANNDPAHLLRPVTMHEAPGGKVSPFMRQETELANKERSDNAIASGGSALPTPIGQTSDLGGFGDNGKKDEALNELRAETERLKDQVQKQQVQQTQVQQQIQQRQPQQAEQFDNSLAEAMQAQMKQLLESWKPKGMANVEVLKPSDVKAEQEKAAAVAANTLAASQDNTPPKIIVSAGTVSYAQLLTEANSDVPGPIMAQIVSGPLSGARAIGGFQVSYGYDKYLVLKFSIADKKGKDYSINAIALDPSTTLGGMATEVDERYFVRVVLPAAAGFLQGLGQALGQGNSTTVSNGDVTTTTIASNGFRQGVYNGLGDAGQTMGQFFQNQANLTKPLVRVAAGTPMGLFFVSSVFEPAASGSQNQQTQTGTPTGGLPAGGVNPYANATPTNYTPGSQNGGYPGATVNGYGSNGGSNSNASAGNPYPNYAQPGYGYGNNNFTRGPTSPGGSSSYGYGQ